MTGRVQGVFYRGATQEAALALGLTGWVRNCADGSVEVFACGNAQALAKLEAWLWQGPPQARVEKVTNAEAPVEACDGFGVRR